VDKAPDAFRTISEVADDLRVPPHVLRFWESRFAQIKPMKRAGGRRYYRPADVDLLRGIHHLLYGEGYTIRGVQRILKEQGAGFVEAVWREGAAQPQRHSRDTGAVDDGRDDDALAGRALAADMLADDMLADGGGDVPDAAPALPPPLAAAQSVIQSVLSVALPAVSGDLSRARDVPAGFDAARRGALSREQAHKLQAVLFELRECRRLLDSAIGKKASAISPAAGDNRL